MPNPEEQIDAVYLLFKRTVRSIGWDNARVWLLGHKLIPEEIKEAVMARAIKANTAKLYVDYEKDAVDNKRRPGIFE